MEKSIGMPVRYLTGVGPNRARIFARIGIQTIEDLFYYFPRRYEDRRQFLNISQLSEGQEQTVKATVLAVNYRRSWKRKGFSIFEAIVGDPSGKISCVWFNQPYLKDYFKPEASVILFGRIQRYKGRLQINSPEFEFFSQGKDDLLSANRIVPVYSLPAGMTQRQIRRIIKDSLEEFLPRVKDFLPYDIRSKNNLLNLAQSLSNIHFPQNSELCKNSHQRLSFEEFFIFQIALALRKLEKKQKIGIPHKAEQGLMESFIASLPFKLTFSQKRVIDEIKKDLIKPQPMQRLLQGDVGCGKTVVALAVSLSVIQGHYQVAMMVPTEILAKQHYDKTLSFIKPMSFEGKRISVKLLTSSISTQEKKRVYRQISEGQVDLVIGTHALLEEALKFKKLGLVVIDEQHKFGVGQRALLPKKGANPDVLIMTATPIPRTLAITLYGDLDFSVISELLPGRLPVEVFHFFEFEAKKAYALAREQLEQGRQAYVIYPVIEESPAMELPGAKKIYAQLKKNELKGFRVGLIHSKVKNKEQESAMAKFRKGQLDVLVATTVLEVGIDVPNATCMIIEHAERFGLAQLHQLRGRIGRGQDRSFCILLSDPKSKEAKARISAMLKTNDGFRIAEEDLMLRGPGEFFGRRQHGLCELKVIDPLRQLELLKKTREEALKLVSADPHLAARQNTLLKGKVFQRFVCTLSQED